MFISGSPHPPSVDSWFFPPGRVEAERQHVTEGVRWASPYAKTGTCRPSVSWGLFPTGAARAAGLGRRC